jgi:pimeloyl-ACP methyl ester carboxylesterase
MDSSIKATGHLGSVDVVDSTFTASHRGGAGSPMLCVHGFTDTWRTWELVLPALEAEHDVLAVTLAGHAGGPTLPGTAADDMLVDALEAAMDQAGFETANLVGNSLGGYLALRLAARGRARTVVALAPAGGWAPGDDSYKETLGYFIEARDLVRAAAPHADAIASSVDGRRRATADIVSHFEHIPAELVAHQIRGASGCDAVMPLIQLATDHGWPLDAEQVTCPVRIVWGTADRLLPWPTAAAGYRTTSFSHADWVVLDELGHCLQLDAPLEIAQLILGFAT